MQSASCLTWIQSVARTIPGGVTITLLPNIFSVIPNCTSDLAMNSAVNATPNTDCAFSFQSTTSIGVGCATTTVNGPSDSGFTITCGGFTNL